MYSILSSLPISIIGGHVGESQWAPYISGVRTLLLKVKPKMAEIEGYSTSVSVPCAEIWIFYVSVCQCNCRAGDWNWRTIAPSISAIFGFTFLLGRMTEVLTPEIYGAHWRKHITTDLKIMDWRHHLHETNWQLFSIMVHVYCLRQGRKKRGRGAPNVQYRRAKTSFTPPPKKMELNMKV